MDAACVYAAACDVAIADAGFRTDASGADCMMLHTLCHMNQQAQIADAQNPKGDPTLALMDFQFARVLASAKEVKNCCPQSRQACKLTLFLDVHAAVKPIVGGCI